MEYGDSTGWDRLEEISSGGVEVVRYAPMRERPPARFSYYRDGAAVCGFGVGEERRRWGARPDLLLSDLIAAGVLRPDGSKVFAPDDEPHSVTHARTLAILEQRFGLSLPRAALREGRLPAYAVRGTPDMTTGREPDYHQVRAWAVNNGYTWEDADLRIPPHIREAFERAGSRQA
ncbi:hypothetical protein ABT237_16805 [Streptomyces sp. NPDC001581]|uniref:hypothetical protein n=1 Tax=Streptomyces sp. NPDC001581 TaxID=3154386 RepID=UPI0033330286